MKREMNEVEKETKVRRLTRRRLKEKRSQRKNWWRWVDEMEHRQTLENRRNMHRHSVAR